MIVYNHGKISESLLSVELNRLSRLGYKIFCIQPYFEQNTTQYVIVYYKEN